MGYYTRVFCKSSEIPSIQQIISHIKNVINDSCTVEDYDDDLNSPNWTNFSLNYKKGKLPLLVEINKLEDDDNLAKEEINEFLEQIGSPGFSFGKRKAISHLEDTKYIVVSQLPTSDIDDDGYRTNGELLKYFADKFKGLLQADGEGFYDGTKLIVKE